ncbi:MAG: translation initiation factor IF-2 N-terminal domain-containing protein, partial [Lachnospiraceae bacterium]|nr:translation initiation factor IF-2 N-terminal domain-containing protein [Lachnospiraceae bacterium]
MAKMKVHEIAKELEKQSKEIIAFLQDKGIEVKAPQSSIEEDVVEMVRKSFNNGSALKNSDKRDSALKGESAGKTEPAPSSKAEEKKVLDSGEKAEKSTVEEKKSTDKENKEAKPVQNAGEAPKKKKKIIFVSNPHNSNIPGQRQGNNDRRPGQGNKPGNGNRQNQNQGRQQQETRHKIIRPLTAPSMPETTKVDFKQNARRMESERLAAKNAQAAQAKASVENTEKQAPVQKENNVRQAQASPKEERYQKNEKTSGNPGNNQGERNERNNTRRPEGANRPAASGGRNDFRGNNT